MHQIEWVIRHCGRFYSAERNSEDKEVYLKWWRDHLIKRAWQGWTFAYPTAASRRRRKTQQSIGKWTDPQIQSEVSRVRWSLGGTCGQQTSPVGREPGGPHSEHPPAAAETCLRRTRSTRLDIKQVSRCLKGCGSHWTCPQATAQWNQKSEPRRSLGKSSNIWTWSHFWISQGSKKAPKGRSSILHGTKIPFPDCGLPLRTRLLQRKSRASGWDPTSALRAGKRRTG